MADIFDKLATGAMTAEQALGQLLLQMAKVALQKRLMAMADAGGIVGNAIQGIGMLLGGFVEGGNTGSGGRLEPAGVVHRGEYVLSKPAVSAIGVDNLDALHASAKRGYANGGLVGHHHPENP